MRLGFAPDSLEGPAGMIGLLLKSRPTDSERIHVMEALSWPEVVGANGAIAQIRIGGPRQARAPHPDEEETPHTQP